MKKEIDSCYIISKNYDYVCDGDEIPYNDLNIIIKEEPKRILENDPGGIKLTICEERRAPVYVVYVGNKRDRKWFCSDVLYQLHGKWFCMGRIEEFDLINKGVSK